MITVKQFYYISLHYYILSPCFSRIFLYIPFASPAAMIEKMGDIIRKMEIFLLVTVERLLVGCERPPKDGANCLVSQAYP